MNPAFEALGAGAFVTELAGSRVVDGRSEEHEALRAAARRGCVVERAVLLVDPSRRGDPDVRELVELDEQAGVRVHLIDAANALPEIDPPAGSLRFAVVDGEAPGGDLDRALAAAEALRAARSPALDVSADTEELVVPEPLARSAPLAHRLAPTLCSPVGGGMPECASYHGLVQYMRLLGLVSTPQRHGQFYRANLGGLARSGHRRVLIAGAVDYSMLAHLLAAYDDAGEAPEVTVLDRCPTPLELCRWYAARKSVSIETEVANVLDFASEEPFDLIATDSLLALLPPELKPPALRSLASALRPGGRLVTTVRIASDAPGGAQRFDAEGAAAFAERARAEASRRAGLLDADVELLAREAERYACEIVGYPVRSREELAYLLEGAGLRLDPLVIRELTGPPGGRVAGPSANRAATYAHVVAVRDP